MDGSPLFKVAIRIRRGREDNLIRELGTKPRLFGPQLNALPTMPPLLHIQWNWVNSTSDNSKTCLTQTKFHGPCLDNDNLLKLLVITRTDEPVVSAIKLPFLWLDVFTFLCNKPNFIVFFSHEKKISKILESLGRKWNTLERNGLTTVAT